MLGAIRWSNFCSDHCKWGGTLYPGVFYFLFVLHTKSATTNNNQTGLNDIIYESPFSRDSNDIK